MPEILPRFYLSERRHEIWAEKNGHIVICCTRPKDLYILPIFPSSYDLISTDSYEHVGKCVGDIIPCKQVPESEFNFFVTAHNAVSRINSRISARPPAVSYLLRGGESKEAQIHPL